MTIAHTGLTTTASSHTALVAWYNTALAPLGYKQAVTFLDGLVVGFLDTVSGNVDWWVTSAEARNAKSGGASSESASDREVMRAHTAFAVKDRASVDAFHQAAVAAGGKCNGAPGLRAQYGENYYAAFVLDLAGNNIEAVCTAKEG